MASIKASTFPNIQGILRNVTNQSLLTVENRRAKPLVAELCQKLPLYLFHKLLICFPKLSRLQARRVERPIMSQILNDPITLPSGLKLPNRIAKVRLFHICMLPVATSVHLGSQSAWGVIVDIMNAHRPLWRKTWWSQQVSQAIISLSYTGSGARVTGVPC